MKIILDARKIDDYGIGVYLRHVFSGLIDSGQFPLKVIYKTRDNPFKVGEDAIIQSRYANYDWREQIEIPFKTRPFKDYFYFSPHYVFPICLKNPLIVAIHDLIHFKFSHFFKPALKVSMAKYFIRRARKKAVLVFTGSQTAKQDLCDMFQFRENQIEVIYHGIAEVFFNQAKSPSPFPFPYITYMGNFKPHKNLSTLLQAFAQLKNKFTDLRLVLMGMRQQQEVQVLIQKYHLEGRVIIKGFIPVEELIGVLDGSEFFVFPSLYEGFGLPPLEAMARKKGVISSTGGSLPEVLGDNALFFGPTSIEDLAEKMILFLNDTTLRDSYAEKGNKHAQSFQWQTAVNQYIKLLSKL